MSLRTLREDPCFPNNMWQPMWDSPKFPIVKQRLNITMLVSKGSVMRQCAPNFVPETPSRECWGRKSRRGYGRVCGPGGVCLREASRAGRVLPATKVMVSSSLPEAN